MAKKYNTRKEFVEIDMKKIKYGTSTFVAVTMQEMLPDNVKFITLIKGREYANGTNHIMKGFGMPFNKNIIKQFIQALEDAIVDWEIPEKPDELLDTP